MRTHLWFYAFDSTSRCCLSLIFINEKKGAGEISELWSRTKKTTSIGWESKHKKSSEFPPEWRHGRMKHIHSSSTSSINKTSHLVGPIESFSLAVFVKLRSKLFFCRIRFEFLHSAHRIFTDVNFISPVFSRCMKRSGGWGVEGKYSFMCGRWVGGWEPETRKTRTEIYKCEEFWLLSFNRFWKLTVKSAAEKKKIK